MKDGFLFFAIVDRGKANDLLHSAQKIGARGGTIFLGEGTMQSKWLDRFGINRTQKEVLLMAVPGGLNEALFTMLREEFKLHKRYKGIAFAVPYWQFDPENIAESTAFDRREDASYICLMTVLKRGLGTECMRFARAAGANGGTIMHARGAGVPQDFYFPLVIEPQKELVLILTPRETAPAIRDAIYTGMKLEKAGSGILFALPVLSTIGLYDGPPRRKEAEK